MPRTINELLANAEVFWPTALAEREANSSIIPRLIESQEKFIGILYVADTTPSAWKKVLRATSDMPANLFLKHLMVLSDVGGEKMQRLKSHLSELFPDGKMHYVWNERKRTHAFASFNGTDAWSNKSLAIDGNGLLRPVALTPLISDVAMLLMHAGSCTDIDFPEEIAERCILGSLLGNKSELDDFVRQRYIHVSRITGGAKANMMGQLTEEFVREFLQRRLPTWSFAKRSIPGISQNAGETDISFDLVAESPSDSYCAIEVSFQVTTNSTIERKAGQAQARQQLMHENGHNIAYVIDGAGNFQRSSALNTICRFSDCTVTMKPHELEQLAIFLTTFER